ncbi:MAG: amidophosphoribosyltransferase [Gammaproteobacteria bacterium]|nr:amidophosphoribosyltransferase [Gammaproteobacteria bacterium]
MCGIVGILGGQEVNQSLYDGLTGVQHRGQDAAGIMTSDGNRVFLRKDNGLVRDVFHTRHMVQLQGNMGIGHARYPTAGCDSRAEAQPFYVNSPFGIALGHNGNLTNADVLGEELFRQDLRQLNTSSDSEILLNILAHELKEAVSESSVRVAPDDIFEAVGAVFRRCQGAYAVLAMIVGGGILAFRDPCGIRPLIYGTKKNDDGLSHMFASESAALDVLDYQIQRDVSPGEAIFIDIEGNVHSRICAENPRYAPCIFEYVYLARPDSILDNVPVYKTRIEMGRALGMKLAETWKDHDIDVVIPVPDTSRTAALEMALVLNLPFREGFIKNRYIGRTFIMPGQAQRKKSVRQKLNAIATEFKDKNVLLVDDSIVRGTTSEKIIQLAREAGAKKVYFASAAPAVRYQNVYGIDMPSSGELVAHGRTTEEVCVQIGADRLIYQELDDLVESVNRCNPRLSEFDTSCFSGVYVTGDITPEYLSLVDDLRNDDSKKMNQNELDLSEVTDINEKK